MPCLRGATKRAASDRAATSRLKQLQEIETGGAAHAEQLANTSFCRAHPVRRSRGNGPAGARRRQAECGPGADSRKRGLISRLLARTDEEDGID